MNQVPALHYPSERLPDPHQDLDRMQLQLMHKDELLDLLEAHLRSANVLLRALERERG